MDRRKRWGVYSAGKDWPIACFDQRADAERFAAQMVSMWKNRVTWHVRMPRLEIRDHSEKEQKSGRP